MDDSLVVVDGSRGKRNELVRAHICMGQKFVDVGLNCGIHQSRRGQIIERKIDSICRIVELGSDSAYTVSCRIERLPARISRAYVAKIAGALRIAQHVEQA